MEGDPGRPRGERSERSPGEREPPSPRVLETVARIDSTSAELVRRVRAGRARPGETLVADLQSAGHGRLGRAWHSATPGDLYLSTVVALTGPVPETLPLLPLVAGAAAARALAACHVPARLKWPNDLRVEGRKLGGLLVEAPRPLDRPCLAVVGLGVNLRARDFPPDLRALATSVARLGLPPVDRDELAAAFLGHLDDLLPALSHPARVVDAWLAHAEPFGREVRVGDVTGTTVGLDPAGRLVVRTPAGDVVAVVGGVVED